MTSVLLSRFTPSLLAPEILERLFVQRFELADRVCSGIRDSANTQNKHYYLITGPRGIGKTHFVSLVYHRLALDPSLSDVLRIAWLREEEWGVASYLDFLLVVLRALPKIGTDAKTAHRYQQLLKIRDAESARAEAQQLLIDAVGESTLLIIAENVDEIFSGLGEEGQQALRGLIQTHPRFTLLVTAQGLSESITSRDRPFYGFFDVTQLNELTFENAVQLITRVASASGDNELARLLASPLGRARIRAVHHLAAGNPRVYVIFSQFIRVQNLDELVQPLLETLDDLTPYYQARMSHLSPQQRKLVQYLAERRGAVPVHEIAEANFIAQNTTSSQLRKLDQLGYVRSRQHGRSSYYELREPLLRLTLEVKKHRGAPVQLIVHFLRLWYSQSELEARLSLVPSSLATEHEYVRAAISLQREEGRDLLVAVCWEELRRVVESRETVSLRDIIEELVAVGGVQDVTQILHLVEAIGDTAGVERVRAYEDLIEVLDTSGDPRLTHLVGATALRKAVALGNLGRIDEELTTYDEIMTRVGIDEELMASALVGKALALTKVERGAEAVVAWEKTVQFLDEMGGLMTRERVAAALVGKALQLGRVGRSDDAVVVWDEVVSRYGRSNAAGLKDQVAAALAGKALTLSKEGQNEEVVAVYDEIINRYEGSADPSLCQWVAVALVSKGLGLSSMGRPESSLPVYEEVIVRWGATDELLMEQWVAIALVNKGAALGLLHRTDEAVLAFDEVIGRYGERGELRFCEQVARALFSKGQIFEESNRSDLAVSAYDDVERRYGDRTESSLREQVATALVSKGTALKALKRSEDAVEAYEKVVRRYGGNEDLGVVKCVVSAMVGKVGVLSETDRQDEVVALCDEVMQRFGESEESSLNVGVARCLINKAVALSALGRSDEAAAAYDEVVERYGERHESSLCAWVAAALMGKGLMMPDPDTALHAYQGVLDRYGEKSDPSLDYWIALALVHKGLAMSAARRREEALAAYDEVVRRFDGPRASLLGPQFMLTEVRRGTLLILAGSLSVGRAAMDAGLARWNGPAGACGTLVLELLQHTRVVHEWSLVVPEFVIAFDNHERLEELGTSLVRAIPELLKGSAEQARLWCELWNAAGERKQSLEIPLRILNAVVSYVTNGNSAALEVLPMEERAVVTNLLSEERSLRETVV